MIVHGLLSTNHVHMFAYEIYGEAWQSRLQHFFIVCAFFRIYKRLRSMRHSLRKTVNAGYFDAWP